MHTLPVKSYNISSKIILNVTIPRLISIKSVGIYRTQCISFATLPISCEKLWVSKKHTLFIVLCFNNFPPVLAIAVKRVKVVWNFTLLAYSVHTQIYLSIYKNEKQSYPNARNVQYNRNT